MCRARHQTFKAARSAAQARALVGERNARTADTFVLVWLAEPVTLESMTLRKFTTSKGEATLRGIESNDIDALIELNKQCFPAMAEQNVIWNRAQLTNHLKLFPDGQVLIEIGGRPVAAIASLIVHLGSNPYRQHTYAGITDGGYFHNHDPEGDTLYGADVYVHPDCRGLGLGHELYQERREVCRRLNLRRILAGGRIHGYQAHSSTLSPEAYVEAVEAGKVTDLVLSFQLREGFVVRSVLRNYIRDPRSRNAATLIEWNNPDYKPIQDRQRKVRVAAVQYQVRRIRDFQEFAEQIEYFVETAFDYRADFVLFPEFNTVQLLSQESMKNLPALEGIARLADLTDEVLGLYQRLAKTYGLHIVGGSHPMRQQGRLINACPLVAPDGRVSLQPKLHITPSEKR